MNRLNKKILVGMGFLFNVRTSTQSHLNIGTCQMAAVQPPLKTSNVSAKDAKFRQEWEARQTREALDLIKK